MPKNEERFPASPIGGKRGCLCKDNTYNSKCCNGDIWEQGVGKLGGETSTAINQANVTPTPPTP
jgi:hypothetical protein